MKLYSLTHCSLSAVWPRWYQSVAQGLGTPVLNDTGISSCDSEWHMVTTLSVNIINFLPSLILFLLVATLSLSYHTQHIYSQNTISRARDMLGTQYLRDKYRWPFGKMYTSSNFDSNFFSTNLKKIFLLQLIYNIELGEEQSILSGEEQSDLVLYIFDSFS